MTACFLHPPVFGFNTQAVFRCFFKLRKAWQGSGRPPDPRPQLLADFAQAQALPELHEINDGAVIPLIPHRKVNIVAVGIELNDNLVSTVAHDGGPAPALPAIERVALSSGVFTQVDLALEVLQLAVPRHDPLPSFHNNL